METEFLQTYSQLDYKFAKPHGMAMVYFLLQLKMATADSTADVTFVDCHCHLADKDFDKVTTSGLVLLKTPGNHSQASCWSDFELKAYMMGHI